jgi:hypothetical protein
MLRWQVAPLFSRTKQLSLCQRSKDRYLAAILALDTFTSLTAVFQMMEHKMSRVGSPDVACCHKTTRGETYGTAGGVQVEGIRGCDNNQPQQRFMCNQRAVTVCRQAASVVDPMYNCSLSSFQFRPWVSNPLTKRDRSTKRHLILGFPIGAIFGGETQRTGPDLSNIDGRTCRDSMFAF